MLKGSYIATVTSRLIQYQMKLEYSTMKMCSYTQEIIMFLSRNEHWSSGPEGKLFDGDVPL